MMIRLAFPRHFTLWYSISQPEISSKKQPWVTEESNGLKFYEQNELETEVEKKG